MAELQSEGSSPGETRITPSPDSIGYIKVLPPEGKAFFDLDALTDQLETLTGRNFFALDGIVSSPVSRGETPGVIIGKVRAKLVGKAFAGIRVSFENLNIH